MSRTQLNPEQIKGLSEAHTELAKVNKEVRGLKWANWTTAVFSGVIAVVTVMTFVYSFFI
jgi:hypothetical protein